MAILSTIPLALRSAARRGERGPLAAQTPLIAPVRASGPLMPAQRQSRRRHPDFPTRRFEPLDARRVCRKNVDVKRRSANCQPESAARHLPSQRRCSRRRVAAPHITGYRRDDDVLPAAVVPGRTEDENWADLSSGLLRKNEWNQNDVAPIYSRSYAASWRLFQRSASTGSVWESCTRCRHRQRPHGSYP